MPHDSARAPFSFEMFPPRNAVAERTLWHTIDLLAASGPEFMSVTYGANGSSRASSLDVLRYIKTRTDARPLAHLTCVGSSHLEAGRLVREFLDAGITDFLALRGDPPQGASEDDPFLGDLRTASELVQLIHRVQAERAQYSTLGSRDGHGGLIPDRHDRVRVAVAAFPNGHPRSRDRRQNVDVLLAKQASGATLAITQLFFHAEDYFRFVDEARAAGVTVPILPGILPVTSLGRLGRILELTAERRPDDLAARLESAPTEEHQFAVGLSHGVELAAALLDGGAPGIHLYTFNQHRAVLSLLAGLGIITEQRSEAHV